MWFSGIVDAINIATTTPIDEETTQVRFNFMVRKFDDEKLTSTVADAFVEEINKQIRGGHADLGAQGVPAGPGARRHRRPDPEVPQVVRAVLRRAGRDASTSEPRP